MSPKGPAPSSVVREFIKDIVVDNRFCFSFPAETSALNKSVASFGVINPVWIVKSQDNRKTIVSGFRRYNAARKAGLETIPALTFKAGREYDLFIAHVAENTAVRKLNVGEISRVIFCANEHFGHGFEKISDRLFDALGLERSRKIYDMLLAVAGYGPAAKDIVSAGMSLKAAYRLARFEPDQRETLCKWIMDNRYGTSKSSLMIDMIDDIQAVKKKSVDEIIADAEAHVSPDMEKPQRSSRLFESVATMRNPILARMRRDFQTALESLNLPPSVEVIPPNNFEGRHIEFVIRARDRSSAISSFKALSKVAEAESENTESSKLSGLFGWI